MHLLDKRGRRHLWAACCLQAAMSLLDLLGVLLLGVVGTLAVTTVQGTPPPAAVTTVSAALGFAPSSGSELLLILAAVAAALLLTKSVASTVLLRRIFRFLAAQQANVSARIVKNLLSQPITFLRDRSTQETSHALIQGMTNATLIILGQGVIFLSEAVLLVVLALFLLVLDPAIAIGSILFFSVVAVALQVSLGRWSQSAGASLARADIASLAAIQETILAYREIVVSGRRLHYAERIECLRWDAANSAADLQFISAFPKYVLEFALVLGGFALAGVLFATQDPAAAVGTLTLFIAAGSRVIPSLLRIQAAALTVRNAAGLATHTTELVRDLGAVEDARNDRALLRPAPEEVTQAKGEFVPSVSLRDVYFSYPGSCEPALRAVSLDIEPGSSVALVGPSGAGKSTLADMILGVLLPERGQVRVSDVAAVQAISEWPGRIAYVPQEVVLVNSTIRANVALGLEPDQVDDKLVWEALERAHLDTIFHGESHGLDTDVGEFGLRLSGGQRQRLGIARALLTRPRLLVLDEATSALDAETEQLVNETIQSLGEDVTTVVIAHRLSTVVHSDLVVYLENGSILAAGKFEQVRAAVPALERQAQIMGLR